MNDQQSGLSGNETGARSLLRCHHCGERFSETGTRILADVNVSDESRVEQIALHELCVPDDKYLRYRWENMRVERLREA